MSSPESLYESLCDLQVPNVIKISPKGEQLVYSTKFSFGHKNGDHAVSTLWLATPGMKGSSRKIADGDFNDTAPAWHPDGNSIAFVSDRAGRGKKSAIYLYNINDKSNPQVISGTESEQSITLFCFSHDGSAIAYISSDEEKSEEKSGAPSVWGENWSYERLRVVDLKSGRVRSLNVDKSVRSCSWSADDRQIAIVISCNPDMEEQLLYGDSIGIVEASTLLSVEEVCALPSYADDVVWTRDDKICFRAPVPLDNHAIGTGVYHVDVDSRKAAFMNYGNQDDAVGMTYAGGHALVLVQHGVESQIRLTDGRILFQLKQEIEGFDACFVNGKTVVALATSDINRPWEVFTTVVGGHDMICLSAHGETFKDGEFGKCHFLKYPGVDGNENDALYLVPATARTARLPLPTVLLIHGGPNTRLTNAFSTYYFYWSNYLLSLGYGVLMPNYVGSSGGGREFAGQLLNGAGEKDYADVIAAMQFAIKEDYADPERLLVAGYSHGGFLTLCCSVYNGLHGLGWKFKAACAGAPVSDFDTMTLSSDIGCLYPVVYSEYQTPWSSERNSTRNRRSSPLWQVDAAVKKSKESGEFIIPPMLLLHGESDKRCPRTQSTGMMKALRQYGLPFELVTYSGQDHIPSDRRCWVDMAARLGRWCDKYIGPGVV